MTPKTRLKVRKPKVEHKRRILSEKQRLSDLQSLVNVCFAMLEGKSPEEISELAQLSISTIRRLGSGEVTLNARFGTIQKLAAIGGLRITSSEYGFEVRLS